MSASGSPIAVAIPSYRRGPVLVDTLQHVLALEPQPAAVLVVDQTVDHDAGVAERLRGWSDAGRIRWLRRERPSIPAAMNAALEAVAAPVVLFLDDDVIPDRDLVPAHARAHASPGRLVAGRVVQPWDDPETPAGGEERELARVDEWLRLVIGANLSVDRAAALAVGGFDENFVGTAYRFEADFARRFAAAGGRVRYEPRASLRHLRAAGGTRAGGHGLFRARLRQARGEYYFWLRAGRVGAAAAALARRPFTAITAAHARSRFADLLGAIPAESLALVHAAALSLSGPRLIGGVRA